MYNIFKIMLLIYLGLNLLANSVKLIMSNRKYKYVKNEEAKFHIADMILDTFFIAGVGFLL